MIFPVWVGVRLYRQREWGESSGLDKRLLEEKVLFFLTLFVFFGSLVLLRGLRLLIGLETLENDRIRFAFAYPQKHWYDLICRIHQ